MYDRCKKSTWIKGFFFMWFLSLFLSWRNLYGNLVEIYEVQNDSLLLYRVNSKQYMVSMCLFCPMLCVTLSERTCILQLICASTIYTETPFYTQHAHFSTVLFPNRCYCSPKRKQKPLLLLKFFCCGAHRCHFFIYTLLTAFTSYVYQKLWCMRMKTKIHAPNTMSVGKWAI